jgi:hypothetical protein
MIMRSASSVTPRAASPALNIVDMMMGGGDPFARSVAGPDAGQE